LTLGLGLEVGLVLDLDIGICVGYRFDGGPAAFDRYVVPQSNQHLAVELFDEHVRKPIRDTAPSDEQAAQQMVEAFRQLLPAVTELVSNHFRRVLLATAEEHIERVGDPAEVEATHAETRRLGRA